MSSHPEPPLEPNTMNIGLFADMPRWIWTTFIAAWTVLFGLFALFFTMTAHAAFAIAIVGFFGLMAFGLPKAMAAQMQCKNHECRQIIQIRTGPLDVRAAAMQILLIPVAAVIGLIAFITLAL